MPGPHMTAQELADELGLSLSALYSKWSAMVQKRGLPMPLHESGTLIWSRAQVYAWLDRDLPPEQREHAMAYRAAAAAAAGAAHVSGDTIEIERSSASLNAKLGLNT